MKSLTSKHPFLFSVVILLVVSALVYLPKVSQFGYFNDDWYLMYDGHVAGPGFFHQVFSIDRPMRAYVMGAAFSLFGLDPLPYHLSAYFFRLLSGVGLLWAGWQLWPRRNEFNLLTALFFLIYPGFLSQPNPIDYQSQIISLAAGIFSVALTIKAVQSRNKVQRWALTALSLILGLLTLGLVDYFFGFEIFRLACIMLIYWRKDSDIFRTKALSAGRAALPFLLVPFGFLSWRLFLFTPERHATDIGRQLSTLLDTPLLTSATWLLSLIQSSIKVIFLGWSVPVSSLGFSLGVGNFFSGFGLAALGASVLGLGLYWLKDSDINTTPEPNYNDVYWLGFASVFGGLIPIVFANRSVDFSDYSRYSLTAATGGVLIITALLFSLNTPRLRLIAALALTFAAAMTHFGNAVSFSQKSITLRNFWWQAAWRAPSIREGTLLAASYPEVPIQEDYFVWGPANMIYYPNQQIDGKVVTPLSAITLADENVFKVMAGEDVDFVNRRGNRSKQDFGNALILTQPNSQACVRILDGNQQELSRSDDHRIILMASFSKIENVLTSPQTAIPPEAVFGAEPAHDWCYYYQKAGLARQLGDWKQVAALGDEAANLSFTPFEAVEWMPFLQAYAVLDRQEDVRVLGKHIKKDEFLRQQACLNSKTWLLSTQMRQFWDGFMCSSGS